MHRVLLVVIMLGWHLPAAAQQPLVDCFSTYDCCVQKHGASNCTQQREGAVQRAAEDAADLARVGATGNSSDPNAALATAIDGEKLNSLLKHIARHLARVLEIEEVGGQPPGENPDGETKNHWWREIKTGVKNIQQALKRCRSRKQMLAALRNVSEALTDAQIADIEARYSQAARQMGEEVGELINCGRE